MIILSENIYLKIGLLGLLEDYMQNNPVGTDHIVIFDRGDGSISVLPVEYALALKRKKMKLYDFLSYNFVSFNAKKIPCTELRENLIRLLQRGTTAIQPGPRKPVRDCERHLLECFFSGQNIRDIERIVSGIATQSLYAKKKNALTKLGIPHNATMVKMLRNWSFFFDYSRFHLE